jgi:hypothetical protein
MLRWMKWIGLASVILLIVSCFIPWVYIETGNLTVSGIDADSIHFGKPGYFHLIMSFFFLVFSFTPRIWAKRSNLFVTAINLGYAVRNFYVISTCSGGECPEKKLGLYFMLLSSIIMLIAALFPDMQIPKTEKRINKDQ